MPEIFAEVHSRDPRLGSIGRSAKVAIAQPSSWQSSKVADMLACNVTEDRDSDQLPCRSTLDTAYGPQAGA